MNETIIIALITSIVPAFLAGIGWLVNMVLYKLFKTWLK